jgi:predicted CopG family antitoxin
MGITKLKKIAVHGTVYQQLKQLGSAGDSFNDVIVRIITKEQAAKGGEHKKSVRV